MLPRRLGDACPVCNGMYAGGERLISGDFSGGNVRAASPCP